MDIDIKKNGKLTLKDTPYFEPIDNTNISFTNMDIGTARITFRIMKHGLPLQVSDKNVYVYAYLESSNGSRAEVIELNFDDPINGLVSLQLDKEFLLAATNTTVKGQLYISMHKWNTVSDDFSDTVALQEFTFTVKDALVNQISGVTKIQYIRTFDHLKTEVKDRILELEEEVGRIETVSNELKELFRTTTQDIKDLKSKTIAELDSKVANSNSAVDDKKTETLKQLDTATTNAINQINNKKEEVLQLITDNNLVTNDMFVGFQNDIQESIDETLSKYLAQVNEVHDDFQST
ncbi:MAG: phage baseplate upper protein, partial [Staphylococcus equorum]|nr:phage baseplate upper protein [Staphylococcus equorum]